VTLDPKIIAALVNASTATVTTVLLKKGLRNVWMRGPRPLRPDSPRLIGRAFTLRRARRSRRCRQAALPWSMRWG
jgi:hypothetical protein